MKITDIITEAVKQRLDPKCWKGHHKEGTKIKGGVRVNNCVPNESVEQGVAEDTKDELYANALEKIKKALANPKLDPATRKDYEARLAKFQTVHEDEETYNGDEFYEAYGELWYNEDEQLDEAEYRGRKVPLGKPMQGDVKKFKVYVKDPKTGNVKKVNFGDPNMRIKKSNPARRKSFRARHNCANPGPRTKARYWSCRKW